MHPDDLDTRLAQSEARVPVDSAAPALAGSRAVRRRLLSFASVPVLALVVGGTALAGVSVAHFTGSTKVDEGPLDGAALACKPVEEAADWLASHGYKDVRWQTGASSGSITVGPNDSLPDPDPEPDSRTAPATGEVLFVWYEDGTVHVVVDPAADVSCK